ncbi:MAG: GntR family transcriptional regulator [Firmicutes bacterium]|nr:GntR family transcriptional regulator [Bacillota bacterium]
MTKEMPEKSSEKVEKALIEAILGGTLPPESPLPGERELAARYSVTRPTVREALQRLIRDGWITVSQRRTTLVNDFWTEGNLNVLSTIAGSVVNVPSEFVAQLLEFREVIGPDYARKAVENRSLQLVACLAKAPADGDIERLVDFDWELHRTMAVLSGNRIYPLILNSFSEMYCRMAVSYFAFEECRDASRRFYLELLKAAVNADARKAEEITRSAMKESLILWLRHATAQGDPATAKDGTGATESGAGV